MIMEMVNCLFRFVVVVVVVVGVFVGETRQNM